MEIPKPIKKMTTKTEDNSHRHKDPQFFTDDGKDKIGVMLGEIHLFDHTIPQTHPFHAPVSEGLNRKNLLPACIHFMLLRVLIRGNSLHPVFIPLHHLNEEQNRNQGRHHQGSGPSFLKQKERSIPLPQDQQSFP